MPAEFAAGDRAALLTLESVTKVFRSRRAGQSAVKRAVDDVSFAIQPGTSLGLIGQSGSGKTTLARLITGVDTPTSGSIRLGDTQVDQLHRRELRAYRHGVQFVFQDPYAALNPASRIGYIISRPLVNYAGVAPDQAGSHVLELLAKVGLTPPEQFEPKLPHQLSGGQRQRVVIARALASRPRLIVADEPVSMLDVSLRAGIIGLLRDLRESDGISLLYITHDLLSARAVADDLVVLQDGRVVEQGPARQVVQHPQHEYTRRLIDALPQPGRRPADTADQREKTTTSQGGRLERAD
jgi:peptide/nickel transport system ATP-binding protein